MTLMHGLVSTALIACAATTFAFHAAYAQAPAVVRALSPVAQSTLELHQVNVIEPSPATRQSPAALQTPPRFESDTITIAPGIPQLFQGERGELNLTLSTFRFTKLHVTQSTFAAGLNDPPLPIAGGEEAVPINSRPDGTSYISFTPLQRGHIGLQVWAEAKDGSIFSALFKFDVAPPRVPASTLVVGNGGQRVNAEVLLLPLNNGKPGTDSLYLYATYPGTNPMILIDASLARFEVSSGGERPVLEIDRSTGILQPLRAGHALVRTSFGGLTNITCVIVTTPATTGAEKMSRCEELLQHGERLSLSPHSPTLRTVGPKL